MLQLNTFNKLNGEMVFDNKKIQILQKLILVHIIIFIMIYGPPKS
jgi:hypothetical protein